MNIFVLDSNPAICARFHCDKHVVKMILETAQLLSSAHHICDPVTKLNGTHFNARGHEIYRPFGVNHPCAKWVREDGCNYSWLHELGLCLLEQYKLRYSKVHACTEILRERLVYLPKALQIHAQTPFVQVVPYDCKQVDPIQAYRDYYCRHKSDIAVWNHGPTPFWYRPEQF